MGEDEKKAAGMEEEKPEEEKPKKEAKAEEKPPAEDKKEEKKGEESPPPPPQEIVLRVHMHCEGCARKVRRCLKGFDGVEDVITDCKTSKVVVKGEKADPLKVLERVQRKSRRQVELISPIPKPPTEEEKKAAAEEKKPKPEEKKEEPQPITVVLKVYMHCDACAMEMKKRILRMKGVESAEPDLKSSEVTVKGVFDPPKLIDYVYKRTGKQAIIVKQEPEKKEEEKEKERGKESKEEKKGEEGGDDKEKKGGGDGDQGEKNKEKKKEEGAEAKSPGEGKTGETTVVELKKNEFSSYPSYPTLALYYDPYPPQIFSDENPNACTVV